MLIIKVVCLSAVAEGNCIKAFINNLKVKWKTVVRPQHIHDINVTLLEEFKHQLTFQKTEVLLTIFTTWTDIPEKNGVHNLTIHNLVSLQPFVTVVVYTNESSVQEKCATFNIDTRPLTRTGVNGLPILKYMFIDAIEHYTSTFYSYSNSDILFTDSLINSLIHIKKAFSDPVKPLLVVGKRTNVLNVTNEEVKTFKDITYLANLRGQLFGSWAEDYFITTSSFSWKDIPEVVIGRVAYDNFLVYFARKSQFIVIGGTNTILASHRNFEGASKDNKDINDVLIKETYPNVSYSADVTECTELFTCYSYKNVIVKSRNLESTCSVSIVIYLYLRMYNKTYSTFSTCVSACDKYFI